MIKFKLLLTFFAAFLCLSTGYTKSSMELYDGVVAVVNGIPILNSNLQFKFEDLKKTKRINPSQYNYELSRALDTLIADTLVYEVAQNESLLVTDERVINQLAPIINNFAESKTSTPEEAQKMITALNQGLERKGTGLPAPKASQAIVDEFAGILEDREKKSFVSIFNDLKASIRKELVMSISIGVTPPTREEVKKWYNQNRNKVGYEIWVKHILIRPKGGGLSAERDANQRISDIHRRALAGESFEALARTHSEDRGSAVKGGDIGWVELHALDPYFANNVYRLQSRGQISPVFKSGFGYHIAMFMGRRTTSYEKLERMIMMKLYHENMQKQFDKWISSRRENSDIQIFLDNYVEAR